MNRQHDVDKTSTTHSVMDYEFYRNRARRLLLVGQGARADVRRESVPLVSRQAVQAEVAVVVD